MTKVGDVVKIAPEPYGNLWVGWSDNPEVYSTRKRIYVAPGLGLYIGCANHHAQLLLCTGQLVWLTFAAIRGVDEDG